MVALELEVVTFILFASYNLVRNIYKQFVSVAHWLPRNEALSSLKKVILTTHSKLLRSARNLKNVPSKILYTKKYRD